MLGGEGDSPYSERTDLHNKQIPYVSVRVQLGYVPDISEFRRPLSPTSIRQKTLKKTTLIFKVVLCLAEREGFEPSVRF